MTGAELIGETEDRDAGAPMLLLSQHDTAADNLHRLMDRLRDDYGYEIDKEYAGDHQTVYAVFPGGDSQ